MDKISRQIARLATVCFLTLSIPSDSLRNFGTTSPFYIPQRALVRTCMQAPDAGRWGVLTTRI